MNRYLLRALLIHVAHDIPRSPPGGANSKMHSLRHPLAVRRSLYHHGHVSRCGLWSPWSCCCLLNMVLTEAVHRLSYSGFKQLVRDNKVESLVLTQDEISGRLKEAMENKGRTTRLFTTVRVDDPELITSGPAQRSILAGLKVSGCRPFSPGLCPSSCSLCGCFCIAAWELAAVS